MDILQLVALTVALAGFGGGIGLITNIGKFIGWVKNGQAPAVTTGLNIILLAGVFALSVFKPDTFTLDIEGIDKQVADLVKIGTLLFEFIVANGGARLAHIFSKGTPIVGTSYSKG